MNCCIFDIDGTLIDSAAVDQNALQQALAEEGFSFSLAELRFTFGMPGRKALPLLGVKEEQVERVLARWEELAYSKLGEIRFYDGILDLLAALRRQGKKLGVVTSRTKDQLARGIAPLGIPQYFDEVVCADDVAQPKPAPDGLIECIRRLGGTKDETVYIGDSAYDMQCAKAAGVTSVLALWGCHGPDKLEADMRLSHPLEILKL